MKNSLTSLPCPAIIRYDSAAVSRLVAFSLLSPHPRILRVTGESLRALRQTANGRCVPSASILRYFDLQKVGKDYVCQPS